MWWVFRRSFHNRLHLVFSVTSMTRARQENVMNIVKNGKWVQLLDMVDNSRSLCKSCFADFFVSGQSGEVISPWSEAPFECCCWLFHPSPRDRRQHPSGLSGAQAQTGGRGHESSSLAVHRRLVLPAAIAGVRCR